MNKQEAKKMIEEIRINRGLFKELEVIARKYNNVGTPHNLDGNVLFQLELMYEKLTTILYQFYLGDIEKEYRAKRITNEEREALMDSKQGKTPFEDQEPFFSFGYMTSNFIDNLDDL